MAGRTTALLYIVERVFRSHPGFSTETAYFFRFGLGAVSSRTECLSLESSQVGDKKAAPFAFSSLTNKTDLVRDLLLCHQLPGVHRTFVIQG